ncbi:unnamed protein product, partial [Cylicostephanus goldi]
FEDVNEDDEPIEGCNLQEDNCFTERFEQQDSIVFVDPDVKMGRNACRSKLSDINEETEEIVFGPEDVPDDHSYLFDVSITFTRYNYRILIFNALTYRMLKSTY